MKNDDLTQPDDLAAWEALAPETRASFLLAGRSFPSESNAERSCRLKARLDLVDEDDLSALLGVSVQTLVRWRVDAVGPVPTKISRKIYYRVEDIDAWIVRQRTGALEEPAPRSRRCRRAA